MVSTYTDNLRLTKQGIGDNPNTWGTILNTVIDLVGEAVAGVEEVDITGSSDVTLSTANGTTDEARHATVVLTGTLGDNINLILPAIEKQYFIRGSWTGDYTVTVKISGSSTSVPISTGDKKIVYIDGTDIFDMAPEQESEFVTGDIEPTFRTTAKVGWIFLQGQTVGSTSSGADLTGDSYQGLYAFLWENVSNTYCPVSSGRGVSAAADWAANKTLTVVDAKDRTPFGAGSTWAIGQAQGVETIAKANLPNETLSVTGSTSTDGSHTHTLQQDSNNGSTVSSPAMIQVGSPPANLPSGSTGSAGSHSHTVTGTTEALGSGTSFLPKGFGVNWMIKL